MVQIGTPVMLRNRLSVEPGFVNKASVFLNRILPRALS